MCSFFNQSGSLKNIAGLRQLGYRLIKETLVSFAWSIMLRFRVKPGKGCGQLDTKLWKLHDSGCGRMLVWMDV